MGGKIKNIVLLVVLLIMIYYQHSPVLHAEAPGNMLDCLGQGEGSFTGEDSGEEEPEPIKEYEFQITEPDGRNGYYVTVPEVKLHHASKRGSTVYRLENGGMVRAEGRLGNEGAEVLLSGGQFGEGENILTIYMEDETGARLNEYSRTERILLDTAAPVLDAAAPDGFGAWYGQEVRVSAWADDGASGSGIESLSVCCGEELIGTTPENSGDFLVARASKGGKGTDITLTASDVAGHTASITRKLYIDDSSPRIEIGGMKDYMITSRPVHATFKLMEDNVLKEWDARAEWKDADGEKHQLLPGEWTGNEGEKETFFDFSEDGIYRMTVSATDMAGHTDVKEAQIIIDSHNPVIRYVDRLDGKYVKKFCWNYPKEEFIEDMTSYQYEIKLDENLYSIGEKVAEEGRHILKVEAADAAGNRAEAKAEFMVDHTPPKVVFHDVEEGGIYEEEKTFRAVLENAGDEMQEIRINGILQPLGRTREEYRCTVKERQDYEVAVKACDKAGNAASASVSFQVVPKETFFQKTVKPFKKMFVKEETRQKQELEAEGSKKKGNGLPFLPAVIVCGLGGIGVLAALRRKVC